MFGPTAVADLHSAVAAIRLAAACLSHADAIANGGDSAFSPQLLGDILAGLNNIQGHIVQCAEHLARQTRHQLPSERPATPVEKTELLADTLLHAGDRGQLAAAHLNEARLLVDPR